VVLTVSDDGNGIDPDKVRGKAIERGLIAPDAELGKQQLFELIFQPGFSTASTVSNVSGRGVGMDVVRKNIEALRGEVAVDSVYGSGVTLTIRLPLTLAIIDGLQVRVGKDFFIIPQDMVRACQERAASSEHKAAETIVARGELIPCLSLRRVLSIPGEPPPIERVIITRVDGTEVGLAVDAVIGQQQAVIKSLSRLYKDVRWVSGTTINGDGGISLIVDVPQLVRSAAAHIEAAQSRRTARDAVPGRPPGEGQ
jgi:two-component system, chemotaxis family, sensor kinase CheA